LGKEIIIMAMDYSNAKDWIVAEDTFDSNLLGKCEAIMSLGNGYMGLRSATEEKYLNETRDLFVAGTFNKVKEYEVSELPNAADMIAIELWINDERFTLDQGNIGRYRRELNVKTGELKRSICWTSPKGEEVQLEFCRIVSLKRLHNIAQKVIIKPLKHKVSLKIQSGIDGRMTNTGFQHFSEGDKRFYNKKYMQLMQKTSQSNIDFVYTTIHVFKENGKTKDVDVQIDIERRKIYGTFELEVQKGSTFEIEKISNVYTSRDFDNEGFTGKKLQEKSLLALKESVVRGYGQLAEESAEEWKKTVWDVVPIIIEGEDDFDQLSVRFAQYHLRIMTPTHDNRMNIGAKGLSGEAYKGHTFWDTEIFILPYYIYTNPEIAKKLMEYRYLSLPGAHKKAKDNQYEGAQIPWEAAWLDDGEVTPVWGGIDIVTGLPTKIWSGFIEQHVTSDVAYGTWLYYTITKDKNYMNQYGYELILDTAKFWASRLEFSQEDGLYHINDVVGPDEYKEHVDDNAFTNYMAYWNIEKAIEYYELLRVENPELSNTLKIKLDLERIYLQWKEKKDKIYLPKPRKEDNVIPQDKTYLTLKTIDLVKYKNQEHVGGILRDYSLEQVVHMQVSKQADIMMLFFLFENLFPEDVKKANWNYYEPKTLHDSSLSLSTHSVLACDMKDVDMAYSLFEKASCIDLGQYMKSSDMGIHAASFGGIWQCVVYGFGGIRMINDKLRINPMLPKEWKSLQYTVIWQGDKLQIKVEKEKLYIKNITGNKNPEVYVFDKAYVVDSEMCVEI